MPLTNSRRESQGEITILFGAEDMLLYVLRCTGIHSEQLLERVLKKNMTSSSMSLWLTTYLDE
jgi:hypothetical protein